MTDPRLYQIGTLAALLVYGMGWLDFDITPLRAALILTTALGTQKICDWLMPASEQLLMFPFSSAVRVEMLRRHIRCGVPCESSMAGVKNSETFPCSPRFAIAPGRNRSAIVSRQTPPHRVTSINGIRNPKEFGPDLRPNPICSDDGVVFFHATILKIESDLVVPLF